MSYAAGTTVDPSRTRDEIERLLMKRGADSFGYHRDAVAASIHFRWEGLPITLRVAMPDRSEFKWGPSGRFRSEATQAKAFEEEVRRRWRVLLLLLKAKLEAIDLGLARPIDEFAMYVQLSDGTTIADALLPQLEAGMKSGKIAGLLPMFGA